MVKWFKNWIGKMAIAVWNWQQKLKALGKSKGQNTLNANEFAECFNYFHEWSKRELVKEVIACKIILQNIQKAYGINGDIKRFLWTKDKKGADTCPTAQSQTSKP